MNLQGTSIGRIQQLEIVLSGLNSRFNSIKDQNRDDLIKVFGLMQKVYNQLFEVYDGLSKQGIDVRESQTKTAIVMQDAKLRLRKLGILK